MSRLIDEHAKSERQFLSSFQGGPDFDDTTRGYYSQTGRNSLEDANGVKLNFDNRMATTPHLSDKYETDHSKFHRKEKTLNCADECICKTERALKLIVDELKMVDAAINNLTAQASCRYVPKPAEQKEFAKSVEKNSSVCHVIIGELKKQRNEINEMLQMYERSTENFEKIEATLNLDRAKIERIGDALSCAERTVNEVKHGIAERHENFQLEIKSRRERVETREEIVRAFLNWILSLDGNLRQERKASGIGLKEAIEESDKDRTMLTLAVGQLRQVRKIEISLMTQQRSAVTQKNENKSSIMETRRTTRCLGGGEGVRTAMLFAAVSRDNGKELWKARAPLGYRKIIRGAGIHQRRVPIERRKSPINHSRRPRSNMINVC